MNSRVKLELKIGYLVSRGEIELKIHISEISTLIIQSTAVSVTAALLSELVKQGIKIIFCDEKCSPQFELMPYYGSYNGSKRITSQIAWGNDTKDSVWRVIIRRKIIEQANILHQEGKDAECCKLIEYAEEIVGSDDTNREGHAAKIYFNSLFGKDFVRESRSKRNIYLNYGYAVLLSAFNREIVAQGYLTQIGIWHKNEYNAFNLSCDLMEPFRPVVDRVVLRLEDDDSNYKRKLADILNKKTKICGQNTTMDNAIRIYVRSVIEALNKNDVQKIVFAEEYEL